LNAATGKKIWQYNVNIFNKTSFPKDPQSTPTIDNGYVYALCHNGILFCLNIKNGKLRWKKDLVRDYGVVTPLYGFGGSPVVEGNLLILNVNTSGMALNKETGELVWGSDPPPKGKTFIDSTGTEYPTPVVYSKNGKRCALFVSWEGVSAVEVETGKQVWLYGWNYYETPQIPDPVVLNNKVYLPFEYTEWSKKVSVLLDISGEKPKVLWKSPDLHSDIACPVVLDGYVYGCHGGQLSDSSYALLRCLELESGRLMWEAHPGGGTGKEPVSLMAADGKLIILNDDGTLIIAEATPAGFIKISSCDVLGGEKSARKFWIPPVLCNRRIYCRNYFGDLVCIDVSK